MRIIVFVTLLSHGGILSKSEEEYFVFHPTPSTCQNTSSCTPKDRLNLVCHVKASSKQQATISF
ncbi:hypothetical protein TSMEX_011765 [Taenia solium]|eukprot:TsM_000191000 transcript=TsM_000191000 gene=TsM_000191000